MQGGERWWANIRYSERGDRDEMYGAQASSRIATVALRRSKHIHMQNNYIIQNTHMGHFPQDGENEQNVSFFLFFEASL